MRETHETAATPWGKTGGIDLADQGGLRIVVATPSPDIGDLLAIVLGDAGYAVERASSPEGATALVRARPAALVLTDLFPHPDPGDDMLGAARALRDAVAPCPVGLLTAWTVDTEAVGRAGFACLIRQPFDLEAGLATTSVT